MFKYNCYYQLTKNYYQPGRGLLFRNDRRVHRIIRFQNDDAPVGFVITLPHMRKCIAVFAIAEGWLLLVIIPDDLFCYSRSHFMRFDSNTLFQRIDNHTLSCCSMIQATCPGRHALRLYKGNYLQRVKTNSCIRLINCYIVI